MTRLLCLLPLLAALAAAQEKPEPAPIDLGKVLRGSKEFKEKCARYRIDWKEGRVSAVGEIVYRGGGPCEYLVGVFPTKAHETVVLLDDGPWKGEGRRPLRYVEGLAEVLNNAFLAAGFKRGKPFQWNPNTGEVKLPQGTTVYLYAEWQDEKKKTRRSRLCEWLWNHERRAVMQPGKFVYTGSVIYDEGPPTHKKWLGAEVDGLIASILTTSSSLVDHTEKGGLMNGAYEAIPMRIPESGTRVKVVFSAKELEATEKYEPLKVPEDKKRDTTPALAPEGFEGGGRKEEAKKEDAKEPGKEGEED